MPVAPVDVVLKLSVPTRDSISDRWDMTLSRALFWARVYTNVKMVLWNGYSCRSRWLQRRYQNSIPDICVVTDAPDPEHQLFYTQHPMHITFEITHTYNISYIFLNPSLCRKRLGVRAPRSALFLAIFVVQDDIKKSQFTLTKDRALSEPNKNEIDNRNNEFWIGRYIV